MRLGYAYSRYPVLSQTFCDAEMLELERRGVDITLGSLYPPKTALRHEYLSRLRAPIRYAPDSAALDRAMRKGRRRGRWPERLIAHHEQRYGPEFKAALRARNALFFVELFEKAKIRHFHVHFANRAAHTALFVKAISGIPFSITAHGQDFMADLGSLDLLREICDGAEFIGAETDWSANLLAQHCPGAAGKIFRVYNGLDLSRYPSVTEPPVGRRGLRLVSVGRLVPFKGFAVLIEACAQLQKSGQNFECEIIGDGPLGPELARQVEERNLQQHVRFSGEQSQQAVLAALRGCDLFVLAARVDEQGASDVFPTVIAEAMASGRAVVSTTVAGIPELVADGTTGLLVKPDDAGALAQAIAALIGDGAKRREFGRAGRRRIEQNFTIEKTIEPLLSRFEAQTHEH